MAHQAVGSFRENGRAQSPPRSAPSLGMRGGLGKTLLTAFLLLAIAPLGLLSFVTYRQIQADTGQKLVASLETIVALKEAHLVDWVNGYERELALLADAPDLAAGTPAGQAEFLAARLAALRAADPTLKGLLLLDERSGEAVAAPDAARTILASFGPELPDDRRLLLTTGLASAGSGAEPMVAVRYHSDVTLIGLLDWNSLRQLVTASDGQNAGVTTWLVTAGGLAAFDGGLNPVTPGPDGALAEDVAGVLQGQNGSGAYTGLQGIPVFGAYRWIPGLGVGLVAEYPRTAALAAGNTVTAMVVGATLAVALITAAIAAVVTRRLTVPIVQLTETAAWMARGDLNQKVPITRSDEIGVLARAFNRMAEELGVLYGQLEAKVAERTWQLEEAHTRTRYYAMQLSISAEVARIASSIRSLDDLLPTVVKLIGDAFELHHVAIYLLDSAGQRVVWEAGSNGRVPREVEMVGGPSLVGQVAADGERRLLRLGGDPAVDPEPELGEGSPAGQGLALLREPSPACELAVPLCTGRKMLGVLHLQSDRPDEFSAGDEMVYQSLADQISIAIDNARAYAAELDTVKRLRELDQIQSQFLTNMSHALRTPPTSVIGFSRIMLKGFDGPLTDLQRTDLTTVYKSGRQLLGLINDMLELSQLELGTAAFSPEDVNLAEIIEGVMATARALALSKPVQLHDDVPGNLPVLHTDGQRVRQVILALLSNAVKFTDEGSVWLRVTAGDAGVTISVTDTGNGIPPAERSRILSEAQYDLDDGESRPGFGLAISKRVVERLGGQIWAESEEGVGSTFAFSLPQRLPSQEHESGVKRDVEEA